MSYEFITSEFMSYEFISYEFNTTKFDCTWKFDLKEKIVVQSNLV